MMHRISLPCSALIFFWAVNIQGGVTDLRKTKHRACPPECGEKQWQCCTEQLVMQCHIYYKLDFADLGVSLSIKAAVMVATRKRSRLVVTELPLC